MPAATRRGPDARRHSRASSPLPDRLGAAGNRATEKWIALFRQPAGTEAPQLVTLDDAARAKARRFYTSQPWHYTPTIVGQIRGAVGLPLEGGVDDALADAVARWQATQGQGVPDLVVDGMAGPRTLPRLFRSGLNAGTVGEDFGRDVQSEVVDEWSNLGSARARRDRLVEVANRRLTDADVPPVRPAWEDGVAKGSFDFTTWRMHIGRELLQQSQITRTDVADVTNTVLHEARHCEQFFRIARMRAGKGLSVAGLVAELGIPARIAKLAHADPIARGSMEALIAQGWWDNFYGAGREKYIADVRRAAAAKRAWKQAQRTYEADPTPENRVRMEAAEARFLQLKAVYMEAPIENDAFATGALAEPGITSGSAVPAGPPPEPAATAHDLLPEADLP